MFVPTSQVLENTLREFSQGRVVYEMIACYMTEANDSSTS